ncbi:MAG TPA: (2Fe-2S)-binding protein [Solirubrobacteraceae bacterium]|nr:(2Fe-2S)-binding protein [Solirubrobacteraceae bacterium]
MELTVNGAPRATASSPVTPLLTVLREEFNITGAKPGCEQGGCGACTVLVDGEPRRSCLLAIGMIGDAEITTVEGLGTPQELAPIQATFNDRYAAQCGYCTSGMLMAGQALLNRSESPVTRDQVLEALSGHVCRCTGYVKIVDAVIAASVGEFDNAETDERLTPQDNEPEVQIRGSAA